MLSKLTPLFGTFSVAAAMSRATRSLQRNSSIKRKKANKRDGQQHRRRSANTPTLGEEDSLGASPFLLPALEEMSHRLFAVPETEKDGNGMRYSLEDIRSLYTHYLENSARPIASDLERNVNSHHSQSYAKEERKEEEEDVPVPQAHNDNDVERTGKGSKGSGVPTEVLLDAVARFNPSIEKHAKLLENVSVHVTVKETLEAARLLAGAFQKSASENNSSNSSSLDNSAANIEFFLQLVEKLRAMEQERLVTLVNRHNHNSSTKGTDLSSDDVLAHLEKRCGIASRLHSPDNHSNNNKSIFRAIVTEHSDLQINEILVVRREPIVKSTDVKKPNAVTRVVSLVAPTSPGAFESNEKNKAKLRALLKEAVVNGAAVESIFLRFVLYKENVSLKTAFRFLASCVDADNDAGVGNIISPASFSVNIHLDDEHVTSQLCSVKISLPTLRQSHYYTNHCHRGTDDTAKVSHDAEALPCACEALVSDLLNQVYRLCVLPFNASISGQSQKNTNTNKKGERTPPLAVQVLEWSATPCDDHSSSSGGGGAGDSLAQYSMLLRNITAHHPKSLEGASKKCSFYFPNYFGVSHFLPRTLSGANSGSVDPFSPFTSYDVSNAIHAGRWLEALTMTVAISLTDSTGENEAWVLELLRVLSSGEDRPAVLRQCFTTTVPASVYAYYAAARADWLWNVLCSCRIRELAAVVKGGGGGDMRLLPPESGDFVVQRSEESEDMERRIDPWLCIPKAEWAFVAPTLFSARMPSENSVVPLFDEDEATRHSVEDIVLPMVDTATVACEALDDLATFFGFTTSVTHSSDSLLLSSPAAGEAAGVTFRPLLAAAGGLPRSRNAFSRVFAEPTSTAGTDGMYHLSTDWELSLKARQAGRAGERGGGNRSSYTEASRGAGRALWPLSSRGIALSDRLPAGLAAAAAMTPAASAGRSLQSLALHLSLPSGVYASCYLREFVRCSYHHRRQNPSDARTNESLVRELTQHNTVPASRGGQRRGKEGGAVVATLSHDSNGKEGSDAPLGAVECGVSSESGPAYAEGNMLALPRMRSRIREE